MHPTLKLLDDCYRHVLLAADIWVRLQASHVDDRQETVTVHFG